MLLPAPEPTTPRPRAPDTVTPVRTKVAIDVGPMYGPRTGIGVAVDHMVRALETLDGGPVLTPYVLSFRSRPAAGVRRLPYPAALAQRAWSRMDWPRADRFVGDAQVIHGTNYVVPPSRLARVVTVYDCWFLEHPGEVNPHVRRAGEVLRRAARDGATIHASSAATAAKARSLLDTDRVHVVLLGLPDRLPVPAPHVAGPGGLRRDGPPFIVSIGTQERRKNLPRLIAAFGIARRARTELELVIAGGEGDDGDAIDAAIRRLGPTTAGLHQLGRITDGEKAWLLHHASVLAYPSLDEGFGFPLLEAMQAGRPVVASTAGSIPEIAGDAALLVDPADIDGLAAALVEASSDEPVRRRLVEAGHRQLGRFSWSETARRLDDLYAALAMEHAAR